MRRKFHYVVLVLIGVVLAGCAPRVRYVYYLYQPGTTNASLTKDYRECKLNSLGVATNNKIIHNVADGFIKDQNNSGLGAKYIEQCMNVKGYEYYTSKYIEEAKGLNRSTYDKLNNKGGSNILFRLASDSYVKDLEQNGLTFHKKLPSDSVTF